MKKLLILVTLFFSVIIIQGCTKQGAKSTVDGWMNTLIKKDQEKQQGFVLTKEELYEAYDKSVQNIDLRDRGLVAIPDFCILLDITDQPLVKYINLMSNNITLANQDLSCLTGLQRLNLSYNEIEVVGDLGTLPSLTDLYLQKNNISTLNGFPEIRSLKTLNVSYNNLKSLISFEGLQSLEILEVTHNKLESVIGVERLENLKQLKVEFNELRDIENISDLVNLELVTAKGNELKEGLFEKLDEVNKTYIEEKFGTVGSGVGEQIINSVKSSIE